MQLQAFGVAASMVVAWSMDWGRVGGWLGGALAATAGEHVGKLTVKYGCIF